MADIDLLRLLRATMRFVDRHAERKDGPGVIQVPILPQEMRELRVSLEPFRGRYNDMMNLNRKRIAEVDGAPPTPDEEAVRAFLARIGIPQS